MAEDLREPRRSRHWWFVGAGAVVVAGLIVGSILLWPPPVPSSSPSVPVNPSDPVTTPVPEASIPSPTATGTPTVVPTSKPTSITTGLDDKVQTSPGVTASVERIEAVAGEAKGPGEIAGPALRVTIRLENGSDKSVRTELGLINLYYGKARTPASMLSGPGAAAFPAEIPAGGSGVGTSVFNVPTSQRGQIKVEFSYSTEAPIVIFSGAA